MSGPRSRRNLVHERNAVAVSALAGIVGAFAAPAATAHEPVNVVLIAAGIAFASWAGASAPWWACTATAGVAAALAGGLLPTVAGMVGVALGLWIGTRKRDLPELRALVAGIALNVFCHSDLGAFQGLSAAIAIVAATVLIVAGVRRRPTKVRRRAYTVLSVVGFLAVLSVAGYVIAGASARSAMTSGKQQAEDAITALNQGDFDTAAAKFKESGRAMRRAESDLGKPWALPAAAVPIVSQHRDSIGGLAEGGTDATTAVAEALEKVDPRSRRSDSMVANSPSRRPTFGSHPSSACARVMSGRRRCGSSAGSGRYTTGRSEPVSSSTKCASCSIVNSIGLPKL